MEEAVKDIKRKDNILPKLMATMPQNHETLFSTEVKKYDGIQADVQRNLEHQAKVLGEVERDTKVGLSHISDPFSNSLFFQGVTEPHRYLNESSLSLHHG